MRAIGRLAQIFMLAWSGAALALVTVLDPATGRAVLIGMLAAAGVLVMLAGRKKRAGGL